MQFSYFYKGIQDAECLLSELKEAKIKYVTLNATNCDFIEKASPKELFLIKTAFQEADVRIRAIHAPFGQEADLLQTNERERDRVVNEHCRLIERCPELGIGIVHIHPGHNEGIDNRKRSREESFTLLYCALDRIKETSEKNGVVVAIENMPSGFGSPEDIEEIVKHYRSDFLKVIFDTGHAHIRDGLLPSLQRLGPWIVDLHVHDNSYNADNHLQLPYGTIDWNLFRETLSAIGFTGPITIEALSWGKAGLKRMVQETEAFFSGRILTAEIGNGRIGIVKCIKCGHVLVEIDGQYTCCCN
jgi:sugar phosphate isomerase/epimerase